MGSALMPIEGLFLLLASIQAQIIANPVKRDANGFFKVLLLSSHLLISGHPVQKSKFGACAVTRYCSFKREHVEQTRGLIESDSLSRER